MVMTSISGRVILPGFLFVICMTALTFLLGRFFCGWVCPLGTVIDVSASVRKKHPALNDRDNMIFRKVKFYLLGIFAISALLGKELSWLLDPLVILSRFVSSNLIPALKIIGDTSHFSAAFSENLDASPIIFISFLAILASAIILRRFWCRVLCPLGAVYALLGRRALLRRTIDKCARCAKCPSYCRMGAIKDNLDYAQGECIMCMDCLYDCPSLSTRFKFTREE